MAPSWAGSGLFNTSVSRIVPKKTKSGHLCSQNAIVSADNRGIDFRIGKSLKKVA